MEIIIERHAVINTGCATYSVDSKVFCVNRLLLFSVSQNWTVQWSGTQRGKEKRKPNCSWWQVTLVRVLANRPDQCAPWEVCKFHWNILWVYHVMKRTFEDGESSNEKTSQVYWKNLFKRANSPKLNIHGYWRETSSSVWRHSKKCSGLVQHCKDSDWTGKELFLLLLI